VERAALAQATRGSPAAPPREPQQPTLTKARLIRAAAPGLKGRWAPAHPQAQPVAPFREARAARLGRGAASPAAQAPAAHNPAVLPGKAKTRRNPLTALTAGSNNNNGFLNRTNMKKTLALLGAALLFAGCGQTGDGGTGTTTTDTGSSSAAGGATVDTGAVGTTNNAPTPGGAGSGGAGARTGGGSPAGGETGSSETSSQNQGQTSGSISGSAAGDASQSNSRD